MWILIGFFMGVIVTIAINAILEFLADKEPSKPRCKVVLGGVGQRCELDAGHSGFHYVHIPEMVNEHIWFKDGQTARINYNKYR